MVKRALQTTTQSVLEIIIGLTYPLVGPFARILDNLFPHKERLAGKNIVIVERWFNRNPLHRLWVEHLQRKGFTVRIINFPLQKGTFETSSQDLENYFKSNNLSHVTLVGISGGSITSLLFLQHHEGWKYIDKFISIGAPFHGTPLALFISFVKSGRELMPNSTLVKKISQEKILHPEKIICLAAKFDEIVPRNSSRIEGVKQVVLNVIGHNNFHLNSPLTYNLVAKYAKD